jgi:hypothetical protein
MYNARRKPNPETARRYAEAYRKRNDLIQQKIRDTQPRAGEELRMRAEMRRNTERYESIMKKL